MLHRCQGQTRTCLAWVAWARTAPRGAPKCRTTPAGGPCPCTIDTALVALPHGQALFRGSRRGLDDQRSFAPQHQSPFTLAHATLDRHAKHVGKRSLPVWSGALRHGQTGLPVPPLPEEDRPQGRSVDLALRPVWLNRVVPAHRSGTEPTELPQPAAADCRSRRAPGPGGRCRPGCYLFLIRLSTTLGSARVDVSPI